jgi:uncharacterized protein YceK
MKRIAFPALAAVLLSGCASVMTSETQVIEVTTTTGKAVEVTIDGNTSNTPGSIQVLRDGQDKVIKTTATGCESSTVVEKTISPVFFGNIVIGGLLGSSTDSITGKMWDYADKVEISCEN